MNSLERAEKIGISGFLHPVELEMLVDLACGKDVLEIGSFKGLSSWAMATVAKSLTCIDTWKSNSAGQTQMPEFTTLDDFNKAISRFTNVTQLIGTSEQWAKSVEPDRTADMIFLDAMHTYEDVKADIQRWWPKLRMGGTLVMHDYRHADFPGVEKAADEIFGPAPEGTTLVTLRWIAKG